jgi:hypothetical protein
MSSKLKLFLFLFKQDINSLRLFLSFVFINNGIKVLINLLYELIFFGVMFSKRFLNLNLLKMTHLEYVIFRSLKRNKNCLIVGEDFVRRVFLKKRFLKFGFINKWKRKNFKILNYREDFLKMVLNRPKLNKKKKSYVKGRW